jgi:hypothetical protein
MTTPTSIFNILYPNNQTAATVVNPTDTVTVDQSGTLTQAQATLLYNFIHGQNLNELLMQWACAEAYQAPTVYRNSNGAVISATIIWPDGTSGLFTTDVFSTAFPGAIDAWHATYITNSLVYTITQPQVTRDSNGGVIIQPAITITT